MDWIWYGILVAFAIAFTWSLDTDILHALSKQELIFVGRHFPKRVEVYCKWFDLWIGIFIDRILITDSEMPYFFIKSIHIQPVPCLGIKIIFNEESK